MHKRQGTLTAFITALAMTGALGANALGAATNAPVMTLRLGTAEHAGGPNDSPVLHQFVQRVAELSNGTMRVQLLFGQADQANDYEQTIIGMVQDGNFDLGWSGARAFDVLGVTSFQALQAPFLISSNGLLREVMASTMPAQMLTGLDPIGLVGLGAFPDQLRHPISYHRPMRSLADFEGTTFRVPKSNASDAIYSALGSNAVHLNGIAFDEAMSRGELDGIDYAMIAAPNQPGAWITSNLALYPRVSVLFASAAAARALTSDQQEVLRTAAADSRVSSLSALPAVDAADAFCQGGGHVAEATAEDLAAMIAATTSVTTTMRQDPQTAAFIDQIEDLAAAAPTPEAAHVPTGCLQEAAPPSPEATSGAASIPGGTYTATASRDDAQRNGVEDGCASDHGGLLLTLVIGSGVYSLYGSCDTVPMEIMDRGTYSSTGETVDMGPNCCPGLSTVYSWSLVDGVMTLAIIDETNSPPGDIPHNHFLYEHPWVATDQ